MTAGNPPFRQVDPREVWALPAEALERRTAAVEAAVCAAWERCLAPCAPEGVALVAVGGFGRREQFPYSDVDLLVLTGKQAVPERLRDAIREFLQSLWDSGLRVSHSVRTPSDCAELHEQNVELDASLLDQRFLAGDRGLHANLAVALARFVHGQRQALARNLCRLARERHARYGGSIHQLEPNIKEGPGGLRDYQLVCWLNGLRNAQPDRLSRPEPVSELLAARDFLFGLRHYLHERAGRDSNVLSFDLQEEIADAFKTDPAGWMRRYFGHAREISRAAHRAIESVDEQASSLLLQFRDWRSRVSNAEFYVSRERVYLRAPQRLDYDSSLALRLFEFVGRHGIDLALETERRIEERLPRLRPAFRRPGGAPWSALRPVLAQPHAARALRAMHRTGVLAAIFPEWEAVECLVIRDFYHRYTVDEHTLRAVETLTDLRAPGDAAVRRFADLFAEVDQVELLVLALVFHDLGKAKRTGRHVPESIKLAGAAMARMQMPEEKRRAIRILIEGHLELSAVMNSRDPDDPGTARYVAQRAGTLEILKQLTLLTYADISAVHPGAMTPWRREQLWSVYLIAYHELTRELETERIREEEPGIAETPGARRFLEGFPVRYLRTHTAGEIEAHIGLEQRSKERGVALDISRENGFYRLTLVAHDRPSLLASIAGALAGFGMNIRKAEGFANRNGTILDTFVFEDPHRALELNPTEADRLRLTIERVVLGKLEVRELLRNRPVPRAPSKRSRIAPTVSFDSEASDTATLIEVVAQDRPGLLYSLASAITESGANIEVVLIDTEAHKAIDVFYVTWAGKKLAPAQQSALKAALAKSCGAG
ncbi:MAG: [protein-PII] uridylyltransferase [Acidobacteriota bacterium]